MRTRKSHFLLTALIAASTTACGGETAGPSDAGSDAPMGSDAGPPRDWTAMEPPASTTPEDGIVREVIVLDGADAPANPTTGDDTPDELDRTTIVRFHGADPARAIVIAMPGFLGGAGSFEMLARHLVRRSIAASMPLEVWAIDRRSNLLEDRRGLDTAEVLGDPDAARGYYFGTDTLDGAAFPGFLGQEDLAYVSEWGLATHVGDLEAVIGRVPADLRQGHLFLMGHSLGGSFAETYAAWRFPDGTRGAERLAGVILVDGAEGEAPITEDEYRNGTGSGLMSSPGVIEIRSTTRTFELPFLGVAVYARAEIAAMQALLAPDDVIEDRGRDMVLSTLLSLPIARIPAMTNEAAFGFAFDDASNGLSFAAVSCGTHSGGPVEPYMSLFGSTLAHPSDPSATYAWIDADASDPLEQTPIANIAHSWVDGRTNFGEWYFPARLSLDLAAVGGLAVEEGSFALAEGLRAMDGAAMDAPVLAIAAGLRSVDSYAASRARGAPIGAGRRHEGALRTSDEAYRVIDATSMTHIDPLSAADTDRNPVPGAVLAFVSENVLDGTVTPELP